MDKFYKTKIEIVVLSDRRLGIAGESLSDIIREMDCGDFVGNTTINDSIEMTKEETIEALVEVGSDASFFGLDDDAEWI